MGTIGNADKPQLTTDLVTTAVNAGLIDPQLFDSMTAKTIAGGMMTRSADALIRADRAFKQASAEHHTADITKQDPVDTKAKLDVRTEDLDLAQTLHNAVVAKLDGQPGWATAFAFVRDVVS